MYTAVAVSFARAFHINGWKTRRAARGRRHTKRVANRELRRRLAHAMRVAVGRGEYDFDPLPRNFRPYTGRDVL